MGSVKQKAFTLIELLVVVSIIALLLAITMPALSKAREHSRRAVCGSGLRQVGILMNLYAMDNSNKYPVPYSAWYPYGAQQAYQNFPMKGLIGLLPYLDIQQKGQSGVDRMNIFWCPSGKFKYDPFQWLSTAFANFGYNLYANAGLLHSPQKNTDRGNWVTVTDIMFEGVANPLYQDGAFPRSNHSKFKTVGRLTAYTVNAPTGGNAVHVGGHVTWYNDQTVNDTNSRVEVNIIPEANLTGPQGGKWIYPKTP